ncbi:hypothetical protein SDC9_65087 [bioreactor metagenome]|uniref:Uncharacterized protein n=1 Tax=bioreactor metagenome TaxID=1076179 RepID=A0A644XX92_9ZZZZ
MAAGVVNALKAVDVKHEDSHWLLFVPSDKCRKERREQFSVRKPRKVVCILNFNNAPVVIDKNGRSHQNTYK